MTQVAVCIVTRRRPEGLRRTLLSLNELALDSRENVGVKIVVVDNDPAGSGREAVDEVGGLRFPVDYVLEARHGIPMARNTAIKRAGSVDFVAFIDDDEWADPDWLAELLAAQAESGAEIVVGPVVPDYVTAPPPWLIRDAYFDPLTYRHLESMHFAYTSNVLIDSSALSIEEGPFSERFARAGGSDTHFFMRAVRDGFSIVWAPRAHVHEAIPEQRMRIGWTVRREFRRGTTLSLCLLDLDPSLRRRAKRTAHGLGRIGLGAAVASASVVRGPRSLARGLQQIAFGAGLLVGLSGRGYDEYSERRLP